MNFYKNLHYLSLQGFKRMMINYSKNIQNLKKNINFSSSAIFNNKLSIEPSSCYHDEEVSIKVSGLQPQAKITLTASMEDIRKHKFMSYLHFVADNDGSIDLQNAKSLGGSYTGVFPMGPISCMLPAPTGKKYLRFSKKDIVSPSEVVLNVISGHLDGHDATNPKEELILDSKTHYRKYFSDGIQRIPIRIGKVRATLFLPEGEGPFPGVIDLFGTAGGLTEFRSAQLANRGIASMALAYFNFEDLPKDLDVMDIAYFEEATKILINHPKVIKSGIGAVGVSKGGDLVCSMAAFIPEVKAVVCINGIPVNTWVPLKVKDKIYPFLHFDISKAIIVNEELISSINMMNDSEKFPETFLPLHESGSKFLFIVSLEDQNWNTKLETQRAIDRMKDKGFTDYELLEYPGAGHLLEPPYSPFCQASYHPTALVSLLWGGNAIDHSNAQVDSWEKMIQFFKSNLV